MSTATKVRSKAKIESIRIEHRVDDDPDTSYLAEYRNDAPSSGFYLDRKTGFVHAAKDDAKVAELPATFNRHEFQYLGGFQHSDSILGWEGVSDKGVHSAYLSCRYRANGQTGLWKHAEKNLFREYKVEGWQTAQSRNDKIRLLNILYCCLDARRMERLQAGEWGFLGVIAKAEIVSESGTTQTLRSGGIWGVESDSGKECLAEVASEELNALRTELESFGFGKRAIDFAMKNVTTENL